MRNIVVRPYIGMYSDIVAGCILDIQQKEFAMAIAREDQPDLADIENFYQAGRGNFWVALEDGNIAGTIALKDIGNRQGALRKMFVKTEYRGKGIGTARLLLDTLFAWARKQAMTEVYLGTTAQFLAAHRFYEKNGFIRIRQDALPASFPLMKVDSRFYKRRV